MTKKNRTLAIFALISSILIAELIWWMIFTHQNNERYLDVMRDMIRVEQQFGIETNRISFDAVEEEMDRKLFMFISESVFVIVLILVGIYLVYRSFKQELRFQRQQQNFLLSITHELKTPLASIKLYLQTLSSKKKLSEEKQSEFLSGSLEQVDRLTQLINHVLESTKETRAPRESLAEKIDVVPVFTTVCNEYGVEFRGGDAPLFAHIGETDLELLLSNLVKNAVLYSGETPEGVSVTLQSQEKNVTLVVSDSGVGIKDEHKKQIFERFFRVGEEDTRRANGTGLGLYIVDQLVKKYKGKISVTDNQPKGSTFTVIFPKRIT